MLITLLSCRQVYFMLKHKYAYLAYFTVIYLLLLMSLACLTIIVSLLVLITHHCHKPGPPPYWMQHLANKCKIRQVSLNTAKYRVTAEKTAVETNEDPDNEERPNGGLISAEASTGLLSHADNVIVRLVTAILSEIQQQTTRQQLLAESRSNQLEWRRVARAIDRISFWLILVLLIVQSVVTLLIVPYVGQI